MQLVKLKGVFHSPKARLVPIAVVKRNEQRLSKFIAFSSILFAVIFPEMAFAAGNPIANMLNGLIGFINSDVMRAVGIIAVISLGFLAYFGRISWEHAGKIILGLVLTFGAAGLVDQFSGYVN